MGGFERPLFLFILLALPLYALAVRGGIFRKFEFPLTLSDWNGSALRWTPRIHGAASVVSRYFLVFSFVCVVIAGAGPVRYRNESLYGSRGTAVIFVLDASPSMAAADMRGESRLNAARSYIKTFVARRPGDACGLVGFGSDAALLVPPTRDHRAFLERLESLRIGEFGDGTALGLGLGVAAAHLAARDTGRSIVVMLTDGENNAGSINPRSAAGIYRERAISLYVVGIGSRGEVPVEYSDPVTGAVYSGILDSGFDETPLRDIAFRASGQYVPASNADDLADVFDSIATAVPSSPVAWTRTVEQRLETGALAAAAVLAALSWALRRLFMGAII